MKIVKPVVPRPTAAPAHVGVPSGSRTSTHGKPIVGDRIERAVRAERANEPGADVLFARAHDAVWDAFYMREADGFDAGLGPKRPEQMAFIVKRDLTSALGPRGITFHAERDRNDPNGYRVTGRDRDGNGVDVAISSNDRIHVETIELGLVAHALTTDYRWHAERHDTGRLETHNAAWPSESWDSDHRPNAMTGRGDAG